MIGNQMAADPNYRQPLRNTGMTGVGYGNLGMQAIGPQNNVQENNAIASAQQGLTVPPSRGGSPTMPNAGMQMWGQQAQMGLAPTRAQAQQTAVQAGGVSGPPAPTASQQVPASQGGATVGNALRAAPNRFQGPPPSPVGPSPNALINRVQGRMF